MTKKSERKKKAVTLYLPRAQHEAVTNLVANTPNLTLSGLVENLLDTVLNSQMASSLQIANSKRIAGELMTEADLYEWHGRHVIEMSLLMERNLQRLKTAQPAQAEETPG